MSTICRQRLILFLFINLSFICIAPVQALKLPNEIKLSLQKVLPVNRIRLDGAIETKKGDLYLPLIPNHRIANNKTEANLKTVFPTNVSPQLILFDNGWCFLKVIEKDKQRTIISLNDLSADLQHAVLATKLASDLIVPENFVVPASMKFIAINVNVTINNVVAKADNINPSAIKDIKNQKSEKSQKTDKPKNELPSTNKDGWIIVTSPSTGKISLLTYPDLVKKVEFPIEGTPSGIAYANGKVYIADQSKARILKLDPYHAKFLGQIDLPKGSTPKDVVALPDGKLIYVSENMFSDVAVFETDTDKLLVRTKVHTYPGRMAIDPDSTICLILSVPDGRVSVLSTQTQRFVGTIPVGSLPNGIAFDVSNKLAYVSNRVSNTVSVLDLVHRSLSSVLKTGSGPTGLVVDAINRRLYVANAKDNSISVFDLSNQKKISDIKLPLDLDFPDSMTLLPDKKHILVSSASTDALGLFDINSQTFEKIANIGHTSDQCLWIPGL